MILFMVSHQQCGLPIARFAYQRAEYPHALLLFYCWYRFPPIRFNSFANFNRLPKILYIPRSHASYLGSPISFSWSDWPGYFQGLESSSTLLSGLLRIWWNFGTVGTYLTTQNSIYIPQNIENCSNNVEIEIDYYRFMGHGLHDVL